MSLVPSGVSVFPIGVGPGFDSNELAVLGRHGNQDNTLHLNSMDQLLMLLTLDHGYAERICRGAYTPTLPPTLHTHTHTFTI